MQDREDTDASAEVFGIGRDGEHGLGRSLEQDAVDCGLVLVGDIGDLSRQREHDVEVRHRQELGFALGQPLACLRSLALRTVPIATGVVRDLCMTARLVLAACDMAAELCRAAVLDRRHHLELLEADPAGIGLSPCRSMVAEDIRDLQLRPGHCRPLRWRLVVLAYIGLLAGVLLELLARLRQQVERALCVCDHARGDARVARRRIQSFMPQKCLDDSNAGPTLEQMGGKGVAIIPSSE